MVTGGIADDKVFNTIDLYFSGNISKEEALKRLKFIHPNHQICILNQDILNKHLHFLRSDEIIQGGLFMEANKTILQMKYARIVSIFAEQTGITLEDALDFFYTSSIYQMMNEGIADMHCRSDGYLADLVKEEWKNKNA